MRCGGRRYRRTPAGSTLSRSRLSQLGTDPSDLVRVICSPLQSGRGQRFSNVMMETIGFVRWKSAISIGARVALRADVLGLGVLMSV